MKNIMEYTVDMILIDNTWLKEMLHSHYLTVVVAFLTGILSGIAIVWLAKLAHKYMDYRLNKGE